MLSIYQSSSAENRQSPDPSEFVSAVSWRGNSGVLLAANSLGHIKVSVWLCDVWLLWMPSHRFWRCLTDIHISVTLYGSSQRSCTHFQLMQLMAVHHCLYIYAACAKYVCRRNYVNVISATYTPTGV